jgi:hypothetical protein
MVSTSVDLEARGRDAARRLWLDGLKAEFDDPLRAEFARAAVSEFGRLQRERTPGIYRDALEGAELSAEELNVEEFHGVLEVVQNADDAGAASLRMAVRTRSGRRQLLFAHDGAPVRLPELVAMALAFVSTKREDARTKGRFGIGLKTLRRLGTTLIVHCGPYHALIEGNHIAPTSAAGPIEGLYRPDAGETLLELELHSGFETSEFKAWLERRDSSTLLFLDTLRTLQLINLRARKPSFELGLEEKAIANYELKVGRQSLTCSEVLLTDVQSDRSWRRYAVERPVPPSAPKRRHKATGKTTPLGLAVPEDVLGTGHLYAGLPLETSSGAPFSVNAQFNVNTPRTGALHDPWNGWLLERSVEFAGAVVARRFDTNPASGWAAVPLMEETKSVPDKWIRERMEAGTSAIQGRLGRTVGLEISGARRRIKDIVYEAESLGRLLDEDDFRHLYPDLVPLSRVLRDRHGRWRAVLAELDLATEIKVSDALRLLDGEAVDQRPVSWFIRFARAAISDGEGERLWWRRSIVLDDESRIVPPHAEAEAEVLVRHAQPGSLAARFGLARVVHPAYLTGNPEAAAVRRWLEQSEILVDGIDDEPALRALATRGASGDSALFPAADPDLRALRDALIRLDAREQTSLGPLIGKAISVRGFRWERGKRVRMQVAPAEAYLPAKVEDRPDGWAKAAGAVPSLAWIEPSYVKTLRRARGDRRAPAALAFFRLLGAEAAPRLIAPSGIETRHGDPASPINFVALTPSQREAIRNSYTTHFKDDWLSPDLARVVADIGRERGRNRQRDRGRALLATLDREWSRLYEGHETAAAVYSSHTWYRAASVPASWRAVAMDTAWLLSAERVVRPPSELVVRTPTTEALYGRDAAVFAADVDHEMATSPAVRGLGLTTDPRVSEVVDQLIEMRAAQGDPDTTEVAVRYAAIAAAVRSVDLPADAMVGDLTVRQLRSRFGGKKKEGLIFVEGAWLGPTHVLRGKPIFGPRRAFVPEKSHSDRLWRLLGVRTPTVSDCVAVLNEIARGRPDVEDEQVLLDTYAFLRDHLPEASRDQHRALAGLPLWTGEAWVKRRPIYLVDDREVGHALAGKLAIWRPPLTTDAVRSLLGALQVELLDDRSFTANVGAAELLAGEALGETFGAAVAHLREWLARHDQTLSQLLEIGWDELGEAAIALAPNLRLELRLAGRRPLRVPARAHLSQSPLRFEFVDEHAAGADDGGGRLLGSLFRGGDRDKVALAWANSWGKALAGDRSARLRLAEEAGGEEEDVLDALLAQAASQTTGRPRGGRKRAKEKATATVASGGESQQRVAVRMLKGEDDLGDVLSVSRPGGGEARQTRRTRGLRNDKVTGKPIEGSKPPVPRSAPRAYSPQQQEHLALIALHRAISGELADLRDFRHLQGVGADALDRLERAFEIKSFARAMPDQVTLNANEFKRALQDGTKYHLAVVAGLEQGYDTIVRIIADPVHVLVPQKSTSVVLGGVLGAEKPLEVRFGDAEASTLKEPADGDS